MRLFLASTNFGNHADELIKLVGNKRKILFIFNARDGKNKFYRWWKLKSKQKLLKKAGYQAQELDLRKYFNKQQDLRKFIA